MKDISKLLIMTKEEIKECKDKILNSTQEKEKEEL